MKLIKQLARASAPYETHFPEAEKIARQLIPTLRENSSNASKRNTKDDKTRIIAYWRGHAHKMSDAELKTAIGDDLEQLEYTPEEVSKLVLPILKAIKK